MSCAISTAVIIVGAVLFAGGATALAIEANTQKKSRNREERRRNKLESQYKALQASRQEVIDQSDEIRDLKDEVYNPYANLGVAMQATNMKLEETDEDLANILQSVNEAGAGGGAATQLARMAAVSKAQASANLEQQELQNQKLRIQGEAQMMSTKMNIEQQALQEEIAAWGRMEGREGQDMARVERLESRADARYMMHEQQRSQAVQQIGSQTMQAGSSMMNTGLRGKMGGSGGTSSNYLNSTGSPLSF